ncbi:MAG: LicD family protein, partial [Lachnospiraceae bacterium]|nr:LicD family protein [Lachnospiraceae bacterium]
VDLLEEVPGRQREMLEKCASFLKEGGVLLLGFRNRFGLKYFCGATDDVQEDPFGTLSPEENRLLTRSAADRMTGEAGLRVSRYYYPMPDQFFTQAVYTDAVAGTDSVRDRVFAYDPFASPRVASENALFDDVIHEGLLPRMADYFLAECRNFASESVSASPVRPVEFAALSTDRGQAHGFATVCFEDGTVEKSALHEAGVPYLKQAYGNLEKLAARGLLTVPQQMDGRTVRMPVIREPAALSVIRERMAEGRESIFNIFEMLKADILRSSDPVEPDERKLWLNFGIGKDQAGVVLEEGMIDLIPYNAFFSDGRFRYYDQVFRVEHCPADYIMYRAVHYTWIHIPEMERLIPLEEMKARFGLARNWDAFEKRETRFVGGPRNQERFQQLYGGAWKAVSPKAIRRNRDALMKANPRMRAQELLDRVHIVQLAMLKTLDRVCREHGLRYFEIHGTLLGAVRHGGFIPWDDDADVAMPREDYDRLLALPASVWGESFALQTPENAGECFYGGYAKLRDNATTAIEPQNRGHWCSQGIWIDILPLDRCPADEKGRMRLQKKITRWQRLMTAKVYKPSEGMMDDVPPRKLSRYYTAGDLLRRRWILKRLDRLFRSGKETGYRAILACRYGDYRNRNVYPEEWLADTEEMPFEDFTVPVPAGYGRILAERYGSRYMEVPDPQKRVCQTDVFFDPDSPWTAHVGKRR